MFHSIALRRQEEEDRVQQALNETLEGMDSTPTGATTACFGFHSAFMKRHAKKVSFQ